MRVLYIYICLYQVEVINSSFAYNKCFFLKLIIMTDISSALKTEIKNIVINKEKQSDLNKNDLCVPEIISFELHNSNYSMANLIRSFINYLSVKYLHCNIKDIESTQHVITDNLIQRIKLIPIIQNIKVGTQLNINVTNKSDNSQVVTTKHINDISMNERFRIIILEPKNSIKINMTIKQTIPKIVNNEVTNSDNKNSGISLLQTPLEYKILDYQRIYLLKNREVTEVYIKTLNEKTDNVLFITKKEDEEISKAFIKSSGIVNHDINKLNEYFDKVLLRENLETYYTEQMMGSKFFLKFKTYGNIKCKQLFFDAFDNIIHIYKDLKFEDEGNNNYIVTTYEHIALLLDSVIKEKDPNAIMRIIYFGYNKIRFNVSNIKIITDSIESILKLLNKLKDIFKN